ncbi:MAG: hypothetical protein IRZ16_16960 [Myxococcaceae bacterium]|nr:hypothetical protein [Myxococcaceae bacterium]
MKQDLLYGLTRVVREEAGWIVRVPRRDGSALEYVCRTRQKARYMAAVFKLGPTWFPEPHRIAPARGAARTMEAVARLLARPGRAEPGVDPFADFAFDLPAVG